MFGKKKKENCFKSEKSCSNSSNEKATEMKSSGAKACSNCVGKDKVAPHPTKSCSNCGGKTEKSCSGTKTTKNCK